MERILYSGLIDGHKLQVRQQLITEPGATWDNEVIRPGLTYATLDGRPISLENLRVFLTTFGRLDLIALLELPE